MPKHRFSLAATFRVPSRAPTIAISRALVAARWLGPLVLALGSMGCACCKNPVGENVVAARQLSLRGMEAQQRENWEEAEGLFAQAVKTSPVDERARCRYAETLWKRGARREAVAQMEEAARLSGNDPKLLVELGGMYLAQGDLPRAARRAEQAVAADGRSASAWALRGDVLRREGNSPDALACYHRALGYQDHFPQVQLAAAEIYRESGRGQRGLATLESLCGQFPPGQEPADVLLQKGLALASLGRHEAAAEILTLAARRGEPGVELLVLLGESQLRSGDAAGAGLTISEALAREPSHIAGQALKRQIENQRQQMAATLQP